MAAGATTDLTSVGAKEMGGSTVTSANLRLNSTGMGAGDFMLDQGNAINLLAAGVNGQLKLMDTQSLTVGQVAAPTDPTLMTTGVLTGNKDLTLMTDNNFVINNDTLPVNQNHEVDTGSAPDQIMIKAGMAPTNTTVPVQVTVKGEINSNAGAMIEGSQITGMANTFSIRPGSGHSTTETLMGNANSNSLNCANQSLSIDVSNTNITAVQFIQDPTHNPCNGRYEFDNGDNVIDHTRAIDYKFFGALGTATSIHATSAQTSNSSAPINVTANFVQTNKLGQTVAFQNVPKPPQATPNGFIVSPVSASPTVPFSAPRIAVADVNGDGTPDIIIANGPGGPPLVEVIDGRAIVGALPASQEVISLFYAFDPRFMGGLNIAAGVRDNSGRASIVVAEDAVSTASQAFGSQNEVRIFSAGNVLSQPATNNPAQLVPTASFTAYPDSFLGGVRVAVGDAPGAKPIIVTAPGPGAALPVEVFDGNSLQLTQSFFPYGTGFSDGVFVSVANLQANVRTNDILTGPGSGNPLLEIFNGPVYSSTPNTSLMAFRSPPPTEQGMNLSTNTSSPPFGANTQIFGVSGVAYDDFSNGNSIRDIVVGSGIGQNAVESTITNLKQSDLYKQATVPASQSLFAGSRAPQGVNLTSSRSQVTVLSGANALPLSDTFINTGGQLDSTKWAVQLGAIAVDSTNKQAMGSGTFNLATVEDAATDNVPEDQEQENLETGPEDQDLGPELPDISQADVATQVTVNSLGNGQSVGLVTRYVGPGYNNFYLGQLRNTGSGLQGAIFVNLAGTFYTLNVGSIDSTAMPGNILEFETVGSTLKLIYNKQLIASAMDTSLTAGSVGMRLSNGANVSNFSAAIAATNAKLPFSDDFSITGTASQLDTNWNDQLGNISIQSATATTPALAIGNQDTNLSIVNGINAPDVTVQADINPLGSGQTVGLVARYNGPGYNNFYLAQVRETSGKLQPAIFKYINGQFSPIDVPDPKLNLSNDAGTLEFEVAGYSLKLIFKDNVTNTQTLVAHGTDDSLTTGSVGMRLSSGATLSKFMADAPPLGTLPFSDISAGDALQLNSQWTDQFGNISINAAGQAVGTGDTNLSTVNGINAADEKVLATINPLGSMQTVGLVARYGGPGYNNFYLGQLRETGNGSLQAAIFKNMDGIFTPVAVGDVVSNVNATLEFEAVGNSLKLIYNGKLVAHGFDSSLTTGSVGMRLSNGAAVTSFSADQGSTNATLPFNDISAGDASQLNSHWTDQFGNISVNAANQAVGNDDTDLSTVNGINAGDVTVQGVINLMAGQTVGLVARYGGPGYNNFYLAQLRETGGKFQAAIFKNIGGTFSLIKLGNLSATGVGMLMFKVTGSNLELDLGGTILATGIDTSLTTGSVGMRLSAGATLANFMAS
jgi:hypothetical protein